MSPLASPKVAILATCFNRKDTTLAGLASLADAGKGVDYTVYLVDDASTDGTAEAVAAHYPEVKLIGGNGSLFWNHGMRLAWNSAIADRPDYYLWWNDDLLLLPDSMTKLVEFQKDMEPKHGPKVITVGKVADPDTDKTTYGGYVRKPGRLSRLHFDLVADDGSPCDTMNGNFVLIPARAVEDVGIHAPEYPHSTGDVDYGLRATKAGYKIYQSPHLVGYTPYNAAWSKIQNQLTLKNWRFIFNHPKGIPYKAWLHFCRSHGGPLWPVNFVVRYLKIIKLSA